MILLIILVILLHCVLFRKEHFDVLASNDDKYTELNNPTDCCLINKKFNDKFIYQYTKMKDKMCVASLYNNDSNTQLLIDGVDGWDNKDCKENNKVIGSCRNGYSNKECVDFKKQSDCDKFKMLWRPITCHDPIKKELEISRTITSSLPSNPLIANQSIANQSIANPLAYKPLQQNNLFPIVKDTTSTPNIPISYVWLKY